MSNEIEIQETHWHEPTEFYGGPWDGMATDACEWPLGVAILCFDGRPDGDHKNIGCYQMQEDGKVHYLKPIRA